MEFFERPYTVRRFRGMDSQEYDELRFDMDVQIVAPSKAEYGPEGQRQSYRLNSWSDEELRTADPVAKTRGDLLLYEDGRWYECVSCRYRNHTILRAWRGEWQRRPEGSETYDGGPAAAVKLTGAR